MIEKYVFIFMKLCYNQSG